MVARQGLQEIGGRGRCQFDLCVREKGGIWRHNRRVPREEGEMQFTCEEETEGRLLHFFNRRGRKIKTLSRLVLGWRHQHAPVSGHLISPWPLGRVESRGSSLIKSSFYLWNESWPLDSTGPLRHSRLWQAELAVTPTSSVWLAERGILNRKIGWCNNTLNAKWRKVSKSKTIQLLFLSQRFDSPALITWRAARGGERLSVGIE